MAGPTGGAALCAAQPPTWRSVPCRERAASRRTGFYWALFPLCLLLPGTARMFPVTEWIIASTPLILCVAGYALVRTGMIGRSAGRGGAPLTRGRP